MYYYIHISERIYSDLCRVKRIFYRNPKPLNGHAPFFLAILDPLDKNERIYSDFYALFKPILAIIVGGLNRSDWVGMLRFQHADTIAVLTALEDVVSEGLQGGEIVRLGELGSLQVSVSGQGVEKEEEYNDGLIERKRILFRPGRTLRDTLSTLSFERVEVKPKSKGKTEEEVL